MGEAACEQIEVVFPAASRGVYACGILVHDASNVGV